MGPLLYGRRALHRLPVPRRIQREPHKKERNRLRRAALGHFSADPVCVLHVGVFDGDRNGLRPDQVSHPGTFRERGRNDRRKHEKLRIGIVLTMQFQRFVMILLVGKAKS